MILELGTIISHHYVEVLFNVIKHNNVYSSAISFMCTLKDSCQLQELKVIINIVYCWVSNQCHIIYRLPSGSMTSNCTGRIKEFGLDWEVDPI